MTPRSRKVVETAYDWAWFVLWDRASTRETVKENAKARVSNGLLHHDLHEVSVRRRRRKYPCRRPDKLELPEILRFKNQLYRSLEAGQRVRRRSLTSDDLLTLFVGRLLYMTMDRWGEQRAVALGTLLYSYTPAELLELSGDLLATETANERGDPSAWCRTLKDRLQSRVERKFPERRVRSAALRATAEQQDLIQAILEQWAGWRSFSRPASDPMHFDREEDLVASVLDDAWAAARWDLEPTASEGFLRRKQLSEGDVAHWRHVAMARNHALACPLCGGIPALGAYAAPTHPHTGGKGNGGDDVEPEKPILVPAFGRDGGQPPDASDLEDRLSPEPFDEDDWRDIVDSLASMSARRERFRGTNFQIHVDGVHYAPLDTLARRKIDLPIHRDASQLEIYGRDQQGELLLAVLPVADPGEDEAVPYEVRSDHEGRQRFRARVSAPAQNAPRSEAAGDEPADVLVELSCAELAPGRALAVLWHRFWHQKLSRLLLQILAIIVGGALATGAGVSFSKRLARYNALVEEMGFDRPFSVEFAAVGARTVELELGVHPDVVAEVWVDFGDPSDPDPVGGRRVYPTGELGKPSEFRLFDVTHVYGPVPNEGLRATATVRIVPIALPRVPPASLTPDKLNVEQRLWILPQGVIVDPPAAFVEIVAGEGGVVSARPKVEIRADSLVAPIHLLAVDPEKPQVYRHLATFPPPRFGRQTTYSKVLDLTTLAAGPVRLAAISSDSLEVPAGGEIDWRAIPQSVPRAEIEVRQAGAILEPAGGDLVSGVGLVRAVVNLPSTYAAVLIRPALADGFFVQGDGAGVTAFAELPMRVTYGGRDRYQVYVGITYDSQLFQVGDRLAERPSVDDEGRPVYWLGPVAVEHE